MTLNTCSAHQRKRKLATNAILQVTVALSHGEKRGTSSEKSADGKRRRRGRRKGEERRQKKNIFGPHLHPNSPTYDDPNTISTKREKEGATREKDACLWPTFNTCQKRARRRKRGGEKAAESEENIFGRLSNSPFRPPPPYHTPYPLTRLIEPFDER